MSVPALVAFDLDDTLAASKSTIEPLMLEPFTRLLRRTQVAVISGGTFDQFTRQLLAPLERFLRDQHSGDNSRADSCEALLERLHLLPTCGTRYERRVQGTWRTVYHELLSRAERLAACSALQEEAERLGLWQRNTWGDILEDRGSQITFSALGQHAPVNAKQDWDTDGTKKRALRAAVALRLPDLEVRSGGSTSVDVTRSGIDKAYGMRKLAQHTGIALNQMLFIGDRLDVDGNDYPVKALGVPCRAVSGWPETAQYLEALLG